jgi:hypothetical protein
MSDLQRISDRYHLDKLVHASDTASVFRVTDPQSGQMAALKLVRFLASPGGEAASGVPGTAGRHQGRTGFVDACRALQGCSHPCLPRVFDFGFSSAGAYLVTEYLSGATFDLFAGSPPARVLPLLLPILDAVEELDKHGLAHRNLRAENLLVVPLGDSEEIKVLGWGSATVGTGESGRSADLRAFAEIACLAIGAQVQREPAIVVNLPDAASDGIADASELAILLSILLQPGCAVPASLFAELRRAFGQALHGDAAAAGAELDEDQALRADVTMAVPHERLFGSLAQPAAATTGPTAASAGTGLAQLAAATTAGTGLRTDTLPAFRPGDLAPLPTAEAAAPAESASGADTGAELDLSGTRPTGEASPAGSPRTAPAKTAAGSGSPGDSEGAGDPGPAAVSGDRTAPILLHPPRSPLAHDTWMETQVAYVPPPPPVVDPVAVSVEPALLAPSAPAGRRAATAVTAISRAFAPPEPAAALRPVPPAAAAPDTLETPETPEAAPPAVAPRVADLAPAAPSIPPSAAAPHAPHDTAAPAVLKPPRPVAGRRAQRFGLWVAGGAAAILLVLAVLVITALRRPAAPAQPAAQPQPKPVAAAARQASAASVAAPVAAAPAAAPEPALDARLKAVDDLLASGDTDGARRALAKITPADQAAFAPADRDAWQRLGDQAAAGRRSEIARNLAAGLRRGDVRRLGAALAAAQGVNDLPAPMRRDLDRARQAVDLDTQLAQPDRAQDPQAQLRKATDLLALVPRYAHAGELREQAAKAIEDQAAAALAAGDTDRAAALVAALRQAWPDRPGLQERTDAIETQHRADERLESVLAAAAKQEAAGQPLQGLETLAGATPSPHFRDRFRQQRDKLNQLLAKLDAAPPVIALRSGYKPEYDKGAQIVVPLRITDDLAVKSAECWVRAEGDATYKAVPVRHLSGAEYEVDIPPDLHQNRNLELYAAATDNSGHQTLLGSRDKPLKLKRRNWLEKMLNGKEGS